MQSSTKYCVSNIFNFIIFALSHGFTIPRIILNLNNNDADLYHFHHPKIRLYNNRIDLWRRAQNTNTYASHIIIRRSKSWAVDFNVKSFARRDEMMIFDCCSIIMRRRQPSIVWIIIKYYYQTRFQSYLMILCICRYYYCCYRNKMWRTKLKSHLRLEWY